MSLTPAETNNLILIDEYVVTRAHRERAAGTLSEIGHQVDFWIQTGGIDPNDDSPLNDQLEEVALAFAELEHELLLCPTTTVHGMEESATVCSNCGTTDEDFHTIRDCFPRYKAAQDDAANQVTGYLSEQNKTLATELKAERSNLQLLRTQNQRLESELAEIKQGYEALDRNWAAVHEGAMGPIRSSLDLPDGSVPEIVTAIETLKQAVTRPHTCAPVGVNGKRYCSVCGKDMPDPNDGPLFVFWDEDSVWVVAHDADDAALVYAQFVGDDCTFDTLQFSRCPDELEISIRIWTYGPEIGKIVPADQEDNDAIAPCVQTARLWADQQGRGFLYTTDF